MFGNLIKQHFFAAMLCVCVFSSCKKDDETQALNPAPHPTSLEVPGNFPAVMDDPDNPLTVEGIALGRKLFYDTRLSGNNKISCASCHKQALAFSDGIALSNIGVSNQTLHRHAPPLFNLAWVKSGLFWDGGSKNLESQALGPLASRDEMFQDLKELERELKQVPEYVQQFRFLFNRDINAIDAIKAIAQFERTLVSAGSKYDFYVRKAPGSSLTSLEIEGLALVNAKCRSCHSGELFTDDGYHNNGLDNDFPADLEGIYQGRFRVTFNPADLGKFKTPSLRNVALTAPYMHDGRFKTLDDVLNHYSQNIKTSPTLDAALYKNASMPGIPISEEEKTAIKAFLLTLSDQNFIQNQKFSNPN